MKFNLGNIVMFGIGGILLYAAVKDKNPKDVVTAALGNKAAKAKVASSSAQNNTQTGAPPADTLPTIPGASLGAGLSQFSTPYVYPSN
jgi:hypothetical protein